MSFRVNYTRLSEKVNSLLSYILENIIPKMESTSNES